MVENPVAKGGIRGDNGGESIISAPKFGRTQGEHFKQVDTHEHPVWQGADFWGFHFFEIFSEILQVFLDTSSPYSLT